MSHGVPDPGTAAGPLRRWQLAVALAGRDLLHEWPITTCQVLALAAVLAPLLVLFGLKSGIVTTLTERLHADPRNRELVIVGSYRLEPQWFAELRARPETAFVAPRTRSLAATLDLSVPGGSALAAIEMVPTARGDPLLGAALPAPLRLEEVLLSRPAAMRLGVQAGDHLVGTVARRVEGEVQAARLDLKVIGVVPETHFSRDGVFVGEELMVATEEFRDGRSPSVARPAQDRGARTFASARIFARGLDDVAPLADWLRGENLEVRTRAAEIEMVKSVDRVLAFLFQVIAGMGVLGYAVALAASLWANVDRKRKELALLRLVGFPSAAVVVFPAAQAMLISLFGTGLSLLAYEAVSATLNAVLSSNLAAEEFICRLLPAHATVAVLTTLAVGLVASAVGAFHASSIDPADSLREL